MSFFSRTLAARYEPIRFNVQDRLSQNIRDIVNALGYRRLVTTPDVEKQYMVQRAKDFMWKTFSITGTVCFLNLPPGKERRTPSNPSERKVGNIKLAYFIYSTLLIRGWQAKEIGITTPYTAEAQQYMASLHTTRIQPWLARCVSKSTRSRRLRSSHPLSMLIIVVVDDDD